MYLCMHVGGQGPSGAGTAAVLSDTWRFDLFTKEWFQYASSATVPVMSNLAINPLDNSAKAISFGGRDSFGNPSGLLYTFASSKSSNAWERVLPSGVRPSRRTGNTLVYDQGSARIITSFGLDGNGMQEDTWILDLGTRMWTCWYGSHSTCIHQAPNTLYRGPGKIAFPSQVQAGMYSFLFGGARMDPRSCLELGRGKTGTMAVGSNAFDMWAMDTSTFAFLKVTLDAAIPQPKATVLSSMVAASEFSGFKQPLVLAGGADLSCASAIPSCTLPTPSNEIWVMDAARKESEGTGEKMAELDGEDDLLQIVLPSWCNNVMMMSVLWIDSWLLVMSTGRVKTILFDAYSGSVPRLRWYMEGTDKGNYIKLVLSPGISEKVVKTWGPLDTAFLGTWHHIAMTLRVARQYSRTSSDPALIITQAFLFLDGKHIKAGDTFKTLNLKKDLMFQSGLSEIFVGGTSPEQKTVDFQNMKGALDNVRVWWPTCPHHSDPSKCNPYAFLYPQV